MRAGDSFWSRAAVIAAVVALPLKAGGCAGSTACVTFTQAAYAANGSACPAKDTQNLFAGGGCGQGDFSQVTSVDSEGSFDGEFCCYAVTQAPDGSLIDCSFSGGVGGFSNTGGFSNNGGFGGFDTTTSTGFGGASTVTGTGGAGGMCFSCNDQLAGKSMDPALLCPQAAPFWSALGTCLCGSGPCAPACAATACAGQPGSAMCDACLNQPGDSGCGTQVVECESH